MPDQETDLWSAVLFIFLIFIAGTVLVLGDSLETDREALLNLKSFLEENNKVNRGQYSQWGLFSTNPCSNWSGIKCTEDGSRVDGITLIDNNISGLLYSNLSSLTALSYLDLSRNYIRGAITDDLSKCRNLAHLNLSHNMLEGELNLTGLGKLQTLDLSLNRFSGGIRNSFSGICSELVVANISGNNFTGRIDDCFDECLSLQFLDLSSNKFSGRLWSGFSRLQEFSVSENLLSGEVSGTSFGQNCSLQELDLSENEFAGGLPKEVSNCMSLIIFNVWGNKFNGEIPSEIGLISSLEGLFLGKNNFSQVIPESLLNLSRLAFLDLSKNNFGGDVQKIFGRFTQVKFLVLHGNSYTGGLYTSGILKLQNVVRLDLSFNNFSGPLPVEISQMPKLKYLILASNRFNGSIPKEYGNLPSLQSLDLSFNILTGSIPSSFGNLRSLLWLMLANNKLTGKIPKEMGNCSSLLWLNLANNNLSGNIPPELMNIGKNPGPTFLSNQQNERVIAGSGECLAMKRWIPADYPPFSFVYNILTRKSCRSLWDNILRGVGIFPVCSAGSTVWTLQITGYVQLSGNQLSGEVPQDIGNMQKFSLLHLGSNQISGKLPSQIGQMPLVVLNLSKNAFSGEIPSGIGNIKCLQNLDLSYNNFSGSFPAILNDLSDLNKFNISYNPLISGIIPSTGQLATFEKDSYYGDPYLILPKFITNSTDYPKDRTIDGKKRSERVKLAGLLLVLSLTLAFLICGVLSVIIWTLGKNPSDAPGYLLQEAKFRHDLISSSGSSSPWLSDTVKVIRLDKTAFTHSDILKATVNFSESRIIGKGGFGIVYRGVLPDGREVAVKKLQREGIEGEKEFRAEMEVLSGNSFGWPHPNLVALYGWCLNGSEKLLVYEYMKGGSLEDLVSDTTRLAWRRRIDVAIDVARALVFLHHECYPAIVHRDVKASNVLLDKDGKARVTDFGLARFVDAGDSHVTTMIAGTVGYVAPEYGQTWQATTKGDVYSFGILAMELATGRRAVDGGEECLVEWGRRVMGTGRNGGLSGRAVVPVVLLGSGLAEGALEMCELLRIGIRCSAESPQARPNMKQVLVGLMKILGTRGDGNLMNGSPTF